MSMEIDQIAEAFCSHQFAVAYPYMADEIQWHIVGRERLIGREAVIDQCERAAKYLKTVSTSITKLKSIRTKTCAVVEGAAEFRNGEILTSSVASCDVFQFSDGRMIEITSYIVELNKP